VERAETDAEHHCQRDDCRRQVATDQGREWIRWPLGRGGGRRGGRVSRDRRGRGESGREPESDGPGADVGRRLETVLGVRGEQVTCAFLRHVRRYDPRPADRLRRDLSPAEPCVVGEVAECELVLGARVERW
jgi:hypothetical protein